MSEQPTTRSLREQKKEETRRALSRAAAELLLTEGNEGTTISAIAERAGVSTRTFHNYFPRREDALLTFIEDTIDDWRIQVEQTPSSETPLEVLHRLISDRLYTDNEAAPDPGTLLNLMSISDHLSYVTGPEDKERVKRLADGLVEALYQRGGHTMSRQATALLIVSSLAAAAIAVETARTVSPTNDCLATWVSAGSRSAAEVLKEGFALLRNGFGG